MGERYERQIARYEAARNRAMDEWFDNRPHIPRTGAAEYMFEGAFRMGYMAAQEEKW